MDSDIRRGTPIFTSDGEMLGQVKEIRGTYFKVEANMQPDYWLSSDCILGGFGSERLTVEFDKDELGDYKRTDID